MCIGREEKLLWAVHAIQITINFSSWLRALPKGALGLCHGILLILVQLLVVCWSSDLCWLVEHSVSLALHS